MSSGRPIAPRGGEGASEASLRAAIDDLANQLCVAVDGNFDFAVRNAVEDETLEKLSMLVNFVLDSARRGMAALIEHNANLAELDRAKTLFFSNASHELRTPLTLILGPIEEARARPGGALEGESLAVAHRNAVRLLKLVNALLDFTRLEAGRLTPTFVPTDVAALTTDLAGVFRDAIARAGLTLTIDCARGEPVYVDRQMWENIVLNLLSNAFKFTFDGGITVSLRHHDGGARLEVRDTGVGIPPGELPRLFQRFYRVEGTRSRTHEGFGIGLAMIEELVRLHGGSVEVSSTLGAGTSFVVTIPTGPAHLPADHVLTSGAAAAPAPLRHAFLEEVGGWESAAVPGAITQPPEPEPLATADRARVLVADDNADMRAYVARLLAQRWEVETVGDGEAALAAVKAHAPDLVLCDVMMPRQDGHQVLAALRADPATATIPVVLLSARAGEDAVVEALDAGADDYLVKPFSPRELIARVRTHLELSRLRSDAAVIQRIGTLLTAQLDLETVVQTLTNEATTLSGAAFGAMFYNVLDASGERYMLYTLAGAPREAFDKFPVPRNTELFAPTFRGGRTVRLDDVTRDPRYGTNPPHFGMPAGHLPVRSYLAVPVVAPSGDVLGGLFFGHPRPGVFTERSERLLQAIAAQAAMAIENAHLYQREQAARADAEAASRAKDEFLAMLGHELRNPLAPIVTALQVMELRADRSTEDARAVVGRQVTHLVRLVDDLLDVSRITRGKIELKKEVVEATHIVAKAIELASPILEEHRHQVTVSVPAALPVEADPVRLAQVIANLLTNAAKYTEPGGRITVAASLDADHIDIRVRDTGIGIPPDLLPRVFDLFMQGPQSLARPEGGLGLGLTIVRSLVLLHGGSVEARSDGPGQGSEFLVRLPAIDPAALRADAAAEAAAPLAVPTPRRVLIVDDNGDAADMLAEALSIAGHTTRTAGDGPSALAAAEVFRPDIALLDIGLPVMDGYELAKRLRTLPGLSALRVVAVSGYGQDADRRRSAAAGFDAHLVKPVELDELVPLIDKLAEA